MPCKNYTLLDGVYYRYFLIIAILIITILKV